MTDERQAGLLREALSDAWNDGHRAGIGCGHDLAVCRHDDAAVAAEIDDLASWNNVVRAALAAQVPAQEERLHVERLARALFILGYVIEPFRLEPPPDYDEHVRNVAAAIAAEYRALGAKSKEEGAG